MYTHKWMALCFKVVVSNLTCPQWSISFSLSNMPLLPTPNSLPVNKSYYANCLWQNMTFFFFSFSKHPPPIYYSLWMPSFTSPILFLHSISLPLPQAKPSRHEVDPNNSFLSERPPSSPLCLFPWFYMPPACQFGNTTSRRSIFQCHLSLLQAVSGVLPDVCQLVKPLKLVLLEEETSTEFHEEKTAHVRTGTGKGETCR